MSGDAAAATATATATGGAVTATGGAVTARPIEIDRLNGTLLPDDVAAHANAHGAPASATAGIPHPLYGTTIYIGRNWIDTVYGPFEVLTFQDLIHKGYILALVKGDVHKNDVVYTRLHSSCVTSETLGSLDCDCLQQLNGALELISQKPCGILFYLIQEGRGCGYIGKSRDRMLVQYHNDQISTFEAYARMGMMKDYRNYRSIPDICHILAIRPKFVLLTNNPDKIAGLRNQGMDIHGVEAIEVPPNPWNQQYLISKQQSGHLLLHVKEKIQSYAMPSAPCEPFAPYSLLESPRFVHSASYYLPIRPLRTLLSLEEYDNLGLTLWYDMTRDGEALVDMKDHVDLLDKYPALRRPHWFKVHVYFDIQTSSDLVVLEYRDCRNAPRPPLVRIHSESILSRFPLKNLSYKRKYHQSVEAIVKHGVGMVVLMYHDGRGFGLGHYIIESQAKPHDVTGPLAASAAVLGRSSPAPEAAVSRAHPGSSAKPFMNDETAENRRRSEGRDFGAASILLQHHSGDQPFVMMFSNDASRAEYEKHFPKIYDWMWVGDIDDQYGHQLLNYRHLAIAQLLAQPNHSIRIHKPNEAKTQSYLVAGIGSSEAHARYLVEELTKLNISAKFVPISTPVSSLPKHEKLIVFSQGMSPHTLEYVRRADVLFTAVTETNKNERKRAVLKEVVDRGANVVWFPMEDEYEVLIRVIGPFFGFVAVMHWIGNLDGIPEPRDIVRWSLRSPPLIFSKQAMASKRLSVLLPSLMISYSQNIVFKWVEGVYFSPPFINDYLSWVHGSYQAIAGKDVPSTPHLLFTTGVEPVDGVRELLGDDHAHWTVEITHGILEIEVTMNAWLFSMMNRVRANQRDWPGKGRELSLYSARYN